jgi:hypothetical protein
MTPIEKNSSFNLLVKYERNFNWNDLENGKF